MDDREVERRYLDFEYTQIAQSHLLWAASGLPLVRAADSLWSRARAANDLWRQVVDREKASPLLYSGTYTAEECEVLNDYGLSRVALMLLGLAVENVAKTLLVRSNPDAVVDEAQFQLKSHDLCALLRRADIDVSSEESHHLTIIRDYLEWFGRYPVPLSASGKSGPKSLDGAWNEERLGDLTVTWTIARAVLTRALSKRDGQLFAMTAI